jgi:ADP-ribose pyrophosphatase
MGKGAWQILESEMAVNEYHCMIRRDTVCLPDGRILKDYYLALRPHVAVVFALSADGTVPLVRQYKHGAGAITLELPAGTFRDETPEVAARRELAEETGWQCGSVYRVGEFFDDASKNTNKVFCIVALDSYQQGEQTLDEVEASSGVEVVLASVDEISKLVANGQINAQSSVACSYRALAWLRESGVNSLISQRHADRWCRRRMATVRSLAGSTRRRASGALQDHTPQASWHRVRRRRPSCRHVPQIGEQDS